MKKTPDEASKKKLARKVIAPTRKYFFPAVQRTIEADDVQTALSKLNKGTAREEGDDNI